MGIITLFTPKVKKVFHKRPFFSVRTSEIPGKKHPRIRRFAPGLPAAHRVSFCGTPFFIDNGSLYVILKLANTTKK